MNRKKLFISICLIFILLLSGCKNDVKYGHPTDTLHNIDKLTYDNIEDIVLFTYVPYSSEETARQTVLVNIITKKQYQFDNPDILRTGFYDIMYMDDKMIIPDDQGNRYVLYKENNQVVFKQIFEATEHKNIIGFDRSNALLVVNNTLNNTISKIDLNGKSMDVLEYSPMGEYDDNTGEFLGYYSFNEKLNKILFFGKWENKENQLFVFDAENNVWNNIVVIEETERFIPSISYIYNDYFILYTHENNQLSFVDIASNAIVIKDSPVNISFDAKISNDQLEVLHDNSLIFSGINLDPDNLVVNESYAFSQIVKEGIQRVNYINSNLENKLIFMKPDGLYVYHKDTKEVETIIFMDVNNV